MKPGVPPPFAVALKRKWLREAQVLYKDAHFKVAVQNSEDENRISVSGDLSSHSLNVTISELRATDTDRYYCEFVVESESSEDKREPGTTEFFLLVTPSEYFIFSSHTLLNFFARPHEVGFSFVKLHHHKNKRAKNSLTCTQQFDTRRAFVVWVFPEHLSSHHPHVS